MTEAWKDPGPHHSGKIASLKTQIAGDQVEGTPSEASDIQPAIDAVLAQFRAKGGYDERFDTARALAGVPEGERDDTLFRLACKLRHADVPEDWAERLALEAAASCEPAFDPDLAVEKVHRAYGKYGPSDSTDRLTDLGNAERLAERIRDKAVYVYEAKGWYTFTGKRWEPDTTGKIHRFAAVAAREIYHEVADEPNKERRDAIAKWARLSESRVRREAIIKDAANQPGMTASAAIFDQDPYILACNNGTIDLRTGELRPSRPEDYVSKLAPVDWKGLDAPAPRWDSFLAEIMPDEEIRDYLRVAAGYGATGLSNARAFFICHGAGRNGKGTFLETVRAVLGDYGHTAKPETFLESRRAGGAASTDVASLKGARLVVTSETKRGAKIDTNLVKSLTGDDKINARHIFERPIEFEPTWSVFVATNHKPEMPGDDAALWERVKLIPFDVRIEDEQKDTNLKDKLMTEAPGILAWIVSGAMDYLERGLEDPPAIREATDEYQIESDPIGDFIANYLEVNPGDLTYHVTTAELRQAWAAYCEENDVTSVEAREVGRRLKGTHGRNLIASRSLRHGAQVVRAWTGFVLNDEGEELQLRGKELDRLRLIA